MFTLRELLSLETVEVVCITTYLRGKIPNITRMLLEYYHFTSDEDLKDLFFCKNYSYRAKNGKFILDNNTLRTHK